MSSTTTEVSPVGGNLLGNMSGSCENPSASLEKKLQGEELP